MKKRILGLVLVVCVTLLTASCAGFSPKSAGYDAMKQAVEQFNARSDAAVQLEVGMEIDVMGSSISLPISVEYKGKDRKSETPLSYAKMTYSLLGQTVVNEIYEYDGYTYTVAPTGNTKAPTVGSVSVFGTLADSLLQLDAEAVNKQGFTAKGNTLTLEMKVPEAEALNVFTSAINSTSSVTDATAASTTVSNGSVAVTLKDGELESFTFRFDMDAEVAGAKTTYHMTYTARCSAPGETVAVTLPEGCENFKST